MERVHFYMVVMIKKNKYDADDYNALETFTGCIIIYLVSTQK